MTLSGLATHSLVRSSILIRVWVVERSTREQYQLIVVLRIFFSYCDIDFNYITAKIIKLQLIVIFCSIFCLMCRCEET